LERGFLAKRPIMSTEPTFPTNFMYNPFKRWTVRIPLMGNGMRYNAEDSIECYAKDKKEAIAAAKKHFRNQLRMALKEIKAYERD
jgi:hypothetical protein